MVEVYDVPPPRKPPGLDDIRKPEKCICERTEMRLLICTNGVIQYKPQCLKCGTVGNPVAYSALTLVEKQSARRIDDTLWETYRKRYWTEWNAAREALHEYNTAFWTWYAGYIESGCWKRRRASVLSRDPICTSDGKRRSIVAHHLTYDRAGKEPLFDLVGVCYECHEQIHGRSV